MTILQTTMFIYFKSYDTYNALICKQTWERTDAKVRTKVEAHSNVSTLTVQSDS